MKSHVLTTQMLSRTAIRASKASSMIASRGFRTSAARLSSPYHYPEGPRSNIPFNPLTKYFALRYWGTMGKPLGYSIGGDGADGKTAFFFGLPFGVAGKTTLSIQAALGTDRISSLANEEEQIDAFWGTEDGEWGRFRTRKDERLRGALQCICCGCMLLCISIAMDHFTSQFGHAWIFWESLIVTVHLFCVAARVVSTSFPCSPLTDM